MSDEKPIKKVGAVKTGTQARAVLNREGKRILGPFRITMEVQLTPMVCTTETLVFVVYAQNPEAAVNTSAILMKRFYRQSGMCPPGFPKPVGLGKVEDFLEDRDFQALYRDAKREAAGLGADLRITGPADDPTTFHVVRTARKIISPGDAKFFKPPIKKA